MCYEFIRFLSCERISIILQENLNTTIIGVQSSTRMQTAAADLLNKLNDAQTKINNDGANIVREVRK